MSDIASFAGGLSEAISGYLGQANKSALETKQQQDTANIEQQKEINVAKAKKDMEGTDQGDPILTPEMAEAAAPGAGQLVKQYNEKNPNNPLKMKDGIAWAKQLNDNLHPDDTSKEDNHQDQLEKQAQDRLVQVRGDSAINRTELQRDASGQAYDTIAKAESEKRDLTELEQGDVIRQLIQARTGKTPSDQDVKDLNEKTGKRGFNHMVTYLTGDPAIIGASTPATLKNLKQFVVSTGLKADSQHEGYMAPRLIKPTKLEQSRWDHIVSVNRGLPFQHQMEVSDKTYPKTGKSVEDKKAALRAKLGI